MDSNCFPPLSSGTELHRKIQIWAERLADEGWISRQAAESLGQMMTPSANDLFSRQGRPLVVAFFGGTGVGKSTLLNRLAGEEVARTGIERPTSREVTFYLHASIKLERLPREFPLEKVKIARHQSPSRKEIAWIDLPDIDSVEHANRDLALKLLPYVDVLIYVVSPERYRDEAGWRLLSEHNLKFAWLFVMNHWDEGCEEQIEDFTHQLKTAGFEDPIVLRCDSRQDIRARKPDDFGKLAEILTAFAHAHGVEQLTARNEHLKRKQLAAKVNELLDALGEASAIDRLCTRWREIWQEAVETVRPGLKWPSEAMAREAVGLTHRLTPAETDSDLNRTLLWSTWVSQSLLDALDRLILEAEKLGFSAELIRRVAPRPEELQKTLVDQVQFHLRRSLATPGHWLQRLGLRCFGALAILMPLAASAWAGYQLVLGYFQKDFLGIDFAVHSLLLIGLAWLVPHLFQRLLEPSLEKAALRGIKRGLILGFEQIETEVEQRLRSLGEAQADLTEQGKRLIQELSFLPSPADSLMVGADGHPPLLGRMLADLPS
jgi:GTPase SAR1 family protein